MTSRKYRPKNRVSVTLDKSGMGVVGAYLTEACKGMEREGLDAPPDLVDIARKFEKASDRKSRKSTASIEMNRDVAYKLGYVLAKSMTPEWLDEMGKHFGDRAAVAFIAMKFFWPTVGKLLVAGERKKRGIKPRRREDIERDLRRRSSILTWHDASWDRRLRARLRKPEIRIPSILTE
jgi:hypothetical protein